MFITCVATNTSQHFFLSSFLSFFLKWYNDWMAIAISISMQNFICWLIFKLQGFRVLWVKFNLCKKKYLPCFWIIKMVVLLKRCSKCRNVFPTKLKLSTSKTFAFAFASNYVDRKLNSWCISHNYLAHWHK